MVDPSPKNPREARAGLVRKVGEKESRKLKARGQKNQNIWFGLGMFGMVGWSVVIPTLLGVALGIWIDSKYPGRFSWTLMLLVGGLFLGCLNAWYWVNRESGQD